MTGAEARVAVLLTLMRQLQEVMRAENGLLRDLKLARMRELQGEKAALAESYELELRRLRQTPEAMSTLSGEVRRLLESSMREFQATVSANADRLLQARDVVDAVVQAIGASITAAGPAGRAYAPAASVAVEGSSRVIPVAFDRRC
jgi:hypothetical protein